MTVATFRRRRLFVNRFHYRLFAVSLFHFSAILLIFLVSLFVPLMIGLDSSTSSADDKEQFANMFLILHGTIWTPIVLVFLLLLFHAALVSHRIAGPLYRLRGWLGMVAQGDLNRGLSIRTGDYLHEEAASLNQMTQALGSKLEGTKIELAGLDRRWKDLNSALERGSLEEAASLREAIVDQLERVRKSLDQFRTAP